MVEQASLKTNTKLLLPDLYKQYLYKKVSSLFGMLLAMYLLNRNSSGKYRAVFSALRSFYSCSLGVVAYKTLHSLTSAVYDRSNPPAYVVKTNC
jgi:hypothetical protein